MKTFKPLSVLGAIGALAATSASLAGPVDTSEWKCKACPFEKGSSASVDVGVGHVSDQSAKFSDYTGLDEGTFLLAGGSARMRSESGLFGSVFASDLGLDSRLISAEVGQEGLYSLRLSYDELPRHFAQGARSPFLGVGSGTLTLPAGFPAGTTAAMPLADTLRPLDLGYKRSLLDAGLSWIGDEHWTFKLNARHDVRDGTRAGALSFFSTASQLALPVDYVTDAVEVAASYSTRQLQATVAYHVSLFRNGKDSLTAANPFTPVVPGADRGQLALAPDNEFHQIAASLGYEVNPQLRASADIAYGRMTQDATFLDPTLNVDPAAGLPSRADLPASSLDGKANTFNANLKLTAAPMDGLRVDAIYARDTRENETPSADYPAVSTDMFLGATPRTNRPYSFWQDRYKLVADYRPRGNLKTSAGIEQNNIARSYQEVVTTRETTVWGQAGGQPREDLSLTFKLAHSDRDNSTYGIAQWVDPPQNPLMRKFNLADRKRDAARLRADWTADEKLTLGFNLDLAKDDYSDSAIGLTSGRHQSFGGDLAYALSEATQLRFFAQFDDIRSDQAGSQVFASPDWTARVRDKFNVVGLGAKHLAMAGKLELGGDLTFARSRSRVSVDTGVSGPSFPTASNSQDSLKFYAAYRLKDNLSLIGSYWYERYDAKDWRLDGVAPDTVFNLLAFGEQAPRYHINVFRVGARYSF